MPTIELGYGREAISFDYDTARYEVLAPSDHAPPLTDAEIGDAIDNPIGSPLLEELINAEDTVLIVVSDATRATASAQIINLLVRRLIQFGVVPSDIAVIFATGIHRAVRDEEK